ncbi:hypothetical protein H6764_01995 [Candidatus Nomurabacteria bacterium]|nr:hypothetical protein [Candidatus Nomurabacteria bacterium]
MKSYTKKLLTIVLTLSALLSLISVKSVFAQNDEESQDKLSEQLLVQIPDETDNPNFTITFTDPSGEGVQLKVDGSKYEEIQNPHILPALGVGKHTLIFKFVDDQDTEQEIERTLTIVPRPPEINPPENIDNTRLVITGTAVAGGKVQLFFTGGTTAYKEEIDVTDTGSWEFVFKDDFEPGVYSTIAYVKKKGLASNYSEPVVFSIEKDQQVEGITTFNTSDRVENIKFSIKSIKNIGDAQKALKDNPDLWYVIGAAAAIGALILFILGKLVAWRLNQVSERDFQKILKRRMKSGESIQNDKPQKKPQEDEKEESNSLKAKFEAAGFKTDKYTEEDEEGDTDTEKDPKEIPPKKKKKKKSKKPKDEEEKSKDKEENEDGSDEDDKGKVSKKGSLSKEEFLKRFKAFRPEKDTDGEDKETGEESNKANSPQKSSSKDDANEKEGKKDKNIKITLTSGSLKN